MRAFLEQYLDKKDVETIWNEIKRLEEAAVIEMPAIEEGRTIGAWNVSLPYGIQEYRPTDALSYLKIDEMIKSGPVRFALEMKRSQMVSNFRNKHSIKVNCVDENLAKITEKSLETVLPFMAFEFTWSALVYGSAFMELVWQNRTEYELGLAKSATNKTFTVLKQANLVPHKTVSYIKRTEKGEFDGFVQNPINGYMGKLLVTNSPDNLLSPTDIYVPAEGSLVIPYNGFSRNLWGESFLVPLYPLWFWYEIIIRCLVSYSELMGDPPRIGRAPSKKKVRVTADKLENAIDHLLYLSTNLPNTNSIVIPSDTDENGKYEWELNYMTIPDRSQPFVQILELLNQMILRSALSGDKNYTQALGSEGSKSIGEVHAQATSLHNEMVVTSWVHYLNTYLLPHYSRYNLGENGPPIKLEIQGLDPSERDFLEKVMNIAGNSATFQEWFYMVDWDTLAKMAGLPILSREEADALKDKLNEESLQKQESQLKMAKQYETPNAPSEETKRKQAEKEAKLEAFLENPALFISDHDIKRFKLQENVFDENKVVRDATGKFAKKADPNTNTLGRIAGKMDNLSDEQKKRVEEMLGKIENPTPEMLDQMLSALSFFDRTSTYESPEAALNAVTSLLKDMGIEGLQQIDGIETMEDAEEGHYGVYDAETNTFKLHPDIIEGLKEGSPLAIGVLTHELLHSAQEVFRPMEEGELNTINGEPIPGTIFDVDNPTEQYAFMATVEAQNELLTRVAMSKYLGVAVTPEIARLANYIRTGETGMATGYNVETPIYADYLMRVARRRKVDPYQLLVQEHNQGMDMRRMRSFIAEVESPFRREFRPPSMTFGNASESTRSYDAFISGWSLYRPFILPPTITPGGPS